MQRCSDGILCVRNANLLNSWVQSEATLAAVFQSLLRSMLCDMRCWVFVIFDISGSGALGHSRAGENLMICVVRL